MHSFNVLSRRSFLDKTFKTGLAAALSTLTDIPFVMKRALAEGNIGLNGKKLLFIWLRGANDGLNSVIPIQDPAYGQIIRRTLYIPKDPGLSYSTANVPAYFAINTDSDTDTYAYQNATPLGNGFAALHPSLKFLAPVYNAGELALVHRVGYPNQSRSHFDSQIYWENGVPRDNITKNGIFYRTILESGLANSAPLTGVSIQSGLPLILRGSEAAMTNLSDPERYDLLGVPNTAAANTKFDAALLEANGFKTVPKLNRGLLELQYGNMISTLEIFSNIGFEEAANTFRDDEVTDNDAAWAAANGGEGYHLFPTTQLKNGGWRRPDGTNDAGKYVIPTSGHALFQRLKAAALILNKTDAIIAGTEFSGFDTHSNQGRFAGAHPGLNQQIGWAIYALRKYFTRYADRATWDNMVVITLSEFGRTTIENSDLGTDHASASVMWVAGGSVKGYGHAKPKLNNSTSGVIGCHTSDPVPWVEGTSDGKGGSMSGESGRYLKRAIDYRSVLGEIIRNHLGATQNQLNRIIPGYANEGQEHLLDGDVAYDGTRIMGEVGLV